jgi:hypothetical protein
VDDLDFPDSVRGCYALPIKRAVRSAEDLAVGDIATVTVELIDLCLRAMSQHQAPCANEPVANVRRAACE